MVFVKILGFLILVVGVFVVLYGFEYFVFEFRQISNFYWYKYWVNDKVVVEVQNFDGGKFIVEWDEFNGGNFVIGKGYQIGCEM